MIQGFCAVVTYGLTVMQHCGWPHLQRLRAVGFDDLLPQAHLLQLCRVFNGREGYESNPLFRILPHAARLHRSHQRLTAPIRRLLLPALLHRAQGAQAQQGRRPHQAPRHEHTQLALIPYKRRQKAGILQYRSLIDRIKDHKRTEDSSFLAGELNGITARREETNQWFRTHAAARLGEGARRKRGACTAQAVHTIYVNVYMYR
jgi:hypothetical protein